MRVPHRLLALALVAAVSPPLLADEVVRSEGAAWPPQDARRVSVDVPLGEVRVVGTTDGAVDARLRLTCDRDTARCREQAARVHLRPRRSGSTLELEVVGMDRGRRSGASPTPHLELRMPAELGLQVELGVGEVDVRGLEGDVEIELGVGEVRVAMPEAAVADVSLDVGVGEASLLPRPQGTRSSRFLFLGNEVDWREGSGTARVTVEVGVGEATVKLEP